MTDDDNTPVPSDWTFEGFTSPNYTQVPDELFDELLPLLSGAEIKVLLYVIRRTFGFKRQADTISLAQMTNGIVKRDGTRLDYGAGVSKKTLFAALKSLEARRILIIERRRSTERGDEANVYRLNVVDSGTRGVKVRHGGGAKFPHGGGGETTPGGEARNSPSQETGIQETVEQETEGLNSNIRMASAQGTETASYPQAPSLSDPKTSKTAALGSVGEVLARRGPGFSSPRRSWVRPETETDEWQAIQAYIIDFARLLGDGASTKSSTSRAYRLFLASGLSIDGFLEKMYQARALTQESSASITKTHTDETGWTRKAKMPYFFAVLEDQLKPESQRSERPGRSHPS